MTRPMSRRDPRRINSVTEAPAYDAHIVTTNDGASYLIEAATHLGTVLIPSVGSKIDFYLQSANHKVDEIFEAIDA